MQYSRWRLIYKSSPDCYSVANRGDYMKKMHINFGIAGICGRFHTRRAGLSHGVRYPLPKNPSSPRKRMAQK